MKNGEKGVEIITPFYTHMKSGKEQAILVNRGWVPHDFRNHRMHFVNAGAGTITGVLYRGDNKTKYSEKNEPSVEIYKDVRPEDFALIDLLDNEEEASQFMLHMVDTNEERRQILPTIPTVSELNEFKISPQRHGAYEQFWNAATFLGVLSNTAIWLYF